jgi:hypothetical protein
MAKQFADDREPEATASTNACERMAKIVNANTRQITPAANRRPDLFQVVARPFGVVPRKYVRSRLWNRSQWHCTARH